jgi:hypothetical protein
MLKVIEEIFCWWSVVGYVFVLLMKPPQSKKQGFIFLLISGPVGWVFFSIFYLQMRFFE